MVRYSNKEVNDEDMLLEEEQEFSLFQRDILHMIYTIVITYLMI